MAEIRLRVREIAQSRGVPNIKALAERVGLAYDTAADLWHGRMQRIDRTTLARLCVALDCGPGDVLTMDEQAHERATMDKLMTPVLAAA